MEIKFGKYKGQEIKTLPKAYLKWLYQQEFVDAITKNEIENISSQFEITKQHNGWIGYYNPITCISGSHKSKY